MRLQQGLGGWGWGLIVGVAAALGAAPARAERPAAARLLPDNTVAFVCIEKVPETAEKFMTTAIGKMSQDPQLKPLIGHLYGSLNEAVTEVQDRIGLSLPELLALPQGELAFAVVTPKESQPAMVLLLDAGQQIDNARKLVDKGVAALEEANAKKTEEEVGGVKLTTYENADSADARVTFFIKESLIVAGTNADVVKTILTTLNGTKIETLADNFKFNAIMNRCRSEQEAAPQVVWYFDPIGLMQGFAEKNGGMKIATAMLPSLGLDGLKAVGGTMAFNAGQYDSLAHIHLLLNSPRSGLLKIIAMESGNDTPEPWVPADVVSYTTLHWNAQTSFKAIATVFDSFRGDGALSKEIATRILGPTGVDFEKDILPQLEGRVTILGWVEKPATRIDQAQLLALKLKESEPATKALATLAEKYSERLKPKDYNGKQYYQVELPERPNRPEDAPPLPAPCFAVIDNYLMVANRPSILQQAIVTMADPKKSLANELEYKLVASKIARQCGGVKPALVTFQRPEEAMRMLYDLANAERVRSRLRRNAERNRFFKSINSALEETPLPPFEVIQRYLAPGGALMTDDATGLHYVTFGLRRQTEQPAAQK